MKRRVTIRRAAPLARWLGALERIDAACFPGDDPHPFLGDLTWVALNGTEPVGFGCLDLVWMPRAAFLSRSAVLPEHRGQGIQTRLIRLRVRAALARGAARVVTYTAPESAPSMRSLIRAGLRPYLPERTYGMDGAVYWRWEP